MDDVEKTADRYEGARWFAGLVGAYRNAMTCDSPEQQTALAVNFQDRILEAMFRDNNDLGMMRIIAPAEFDKAMQQRDDEHRIRLAEREAKLKAGG